MDFHNGGDCKGLIKGASLWLLFSKGVRFVD